MARPAPDDSNASEGVLILAPAAWGLKGTADADVMSWAHAQLTGQLRFSRYDAFICFPPEYPATDREPDRDHMWDRLRRRVEQGSLLAFLYPAWRQGDAGDPCEAWRHAASLIRSITGAVLSPLRSPACLEHSMSDDCPQGLVDWLGTDAPDSVLEVTQGTEPEPIAKDGAVVIAGFEKRRELPTVVAGFVEPGGAWLVLPCLRHDHPGSVAEALGLLGTLRALRLAHRTPGIDELPASLQRVYRTLALAYPDFVPARSIEDAYRGTTSATSKAGTIMNEFKKHDVVVHSAKAARTAGVGLPRHAKGYRLGGLP